MRNFVQRKEPESRGVRFARYALPFGFIAVLVSLRLELVPILGQESRFTLFLFVVAITGYLCGGAPALLATFVGAMAGDYFFLEPYYTLNIAGADDRVRLILFIFSGVVVSVLNQALHAARRRSEANLIEAQQRTEELQREVRTRIEAEKALAEAKNELSKYAQKLEEQVAQRTERLQETVRSLEGLVYSIAHDLRAPMRAVQGLTLALQENYTRSLDEAGRGVTKRIVAAAERMDTLVQDLLRYGRLCHQQLTWSPVSLAAQVDFALHSLAADLQLSKARVVRTGPLPTVYANEELVNEVLRELLANAIRFVEHDVPPRIEITATEDEQTLRLWIKDNGVGISPEYHQKIFQVFERIQLREESTGIGLAIVQKAMERMHGQVGVESDSGQGAAFWVEFRKDLSPQNIQSTPAAN